MYFDRRLTIPVIGACLPTGRETPCSLRGLMADYGLDMVVTEIEIALSNLPTLSADQRSATVGQIVGYMRSLQAAVTMQAIQWQRVPQILRDVYGCPEAATVVQAILDDLANRPADEEWEEMSLCRCFAGEEVVDFTGYNDRLMIMYSDENSVEGFRDLVVVKAGEHPCGTRFRFNNSLIVHKFIKRQG